MTQVWTRLDPHRMEEILAGGEGKAVLVLGDVMLDRYLWGKVTRISPEAPVPVVEVERETVRLGGAANVANNLLRLGARPVLVSVVGDDATASLLRREFGRASLPDDDLVSVPGRPTTLKTRIVARSQHVVRADQESRVEIEGSAAAAVLSRATLALESVDAVVISDYGKGVITPRILEPFLAKAKELDIPVCVDPKDTHFFAYTGVAVLTPNQFEAAEVLGYKLRDDTVVGRAGEDLLARLGADCVLITRGSKGMSLFERSGRRTDFPASARRVYDVTGAGDTVTSTYALSLAAGAEPREAALIANHAAGLVVGEVGTAVPDTQGLRKSLLAEDG